MAPAPRTVSGRLLGFANLAVANLAAAAVVLAFVRPGLVGLEPPPALTGIADSARILLLPLSTGLAWLVFFGALVLLLLNFAWLVRRPPRVPPRTWVTSETSGGAVRITRDALEAGLRAAGESLQEITRLRVQVEPQAHKRVLVTGQFQCAEGVDNLQASERLRQALTARFFAMARPEAGIRVDFELEFQGFAGRLARKGDGAPAFAPEPPPFTGPQYPIEEDEPEGGRS